MAYEHSSVFAHSVEEVFAWHARPGAIHRLMPPWQPVHVVRESESLEDGEAVLGMPARVKWVAAHDPAGYQEGRQFVDELRTPVLGSVVRWRHTHSFEDVGGDGDGGTGPARTRVTDRVQTRVPTRLLREMFAYRTRQLAGDLDAHHRFGGAPLTVAVTGSNGLIGRALTALLSTGGHRVVRLVRSQPSGTDRLWQPADPDPGLLDRVDAVVHLAGESIAGRFSEDHKRTVMDSRRVPTRRLAEVAARAGVATFVSASAIGIYGAHRGDDPLDEAAERGDGFLADVVAEWEEATAPAADGGARVAMIRTGIVQTPAGGSLRLLRPLFEAGLGGRLGDGTQWTSWIGLDDVLDIYLWALTDAAARGPVNAVSPNPVTNADYTRTLASVLHRPAVVPVPSFGPALLLGREGADQVALSGQKVVPAVLAAAGHRFRHPELEPALRHVLGRTGGDEHL